jgi:hypothetical protein
VLRYKIISNLNANFNKSSMKLSWKKINRLKKQKQLSNYNI